MMQHSRYTHSSNLRDYLPIRLELITIACDGVAITIVLGLLKRSKAMLQLVAWFIDRTLCVRLI
jgi:hypothetical protein